jgi:hypothetical protein
MEPGINTSTLSEQYWVTVWQESGAQVSTTLCMEPLHPLKPISTMFNFPRIIISPLIRAQRQLTLGSATFTVPPFSFALSGATIAAAQGSVGKSTITVTPSNGYTGSISFVVSAPSLSHTCFSLPGATVTDGNPVTTTLTISTNQATCPGAQAQTATLSNPSSTTRGSDSPGGSRNTGIAVAAAGALIGLLGRRARKLRGLSLSLVLLTMGMIASGCGGGNGSSMTSNPSTTNPNATPKGTYTVMVIGTDAATSTLNSSTTLTFTVN